MANKYLGVAENLAYPLMTLLTDSKKSFSVATLGLDFAKIITLRRDRIANIPASVHTDRNSAPVALGHNRAINSYRMSRSTDMDRA